MGARTLQQGHADMVSSAGPRRSTHIAGAVLAAQAVHVGAAPFDTTPTAWSCPKASAAGHEDSGARFSRRRSDSSRRPRIGYRHRRPRQEPVGPAQGRPDQGHARAYRSGVEMSQSAIHRVPRHGHATGRRHGAGNPGPRCCAPSSPAGKQIPVTSVKANIGHALEAAGVAGVIKTVLCTAAPHDSAGDQHPHAESEDQLAIGPVLCPDRRSRAGNRPRPASHAAPAVNAFGIGGLNMHVVLDEFTPAAHESWAAPIRPAQHCRTRRRSAQHRPPRPTTARWPSSAWVASCRAPSD